MGLKFSQRIGKTPVRETLQVEGMDRGLENGLWNCIYTYLFETKYHEQMLLYQKIWIDFSNKKINHFYIYPYEDLECDDSCEHNMDLLEKDYNSLEWFEKYDLIDFILQNSDASRLIQSCNETLQKHQSAYRIINNQVTPIISDLEIQTIETALENPSQAVTTHLDTALKYLSDRQNPDYRNSVKEAISAVESYCNTLVGEEKAKGIGTALSTLERQHGLDGGLKSAFNALYGYTSNTGGIRHKLKEDDAVITQAEARFMLIACSAFVNYLQDTVGK